MWLLVGDPVSSYFFIQLFSMYNFHLVMSDGCPNFHRHVLIPGGKKKKSSESGYPALL